MMAELLPALAAALLGALLDRLIAWNERRHAGRKAVRLARLEQRLSLEATRRTIEERIADEADLGVLIDRL